jgi:hypothetical protein
MKMNDMSTLDRIDAIQSLLDKLADAQGRAKCGYIYIIDDFMNRIREDVLVMQEQLKDKNEASSETISQE